MWQRVPGVGIVAVADADATGLAAARLKLSGVPGFADYRKMLAEAKPDIVASAPRHVDQHHAMCLAAIAAGEEKNLKLAVANRNRYHPSCRSSNNDSPPIVLANLQSHSTRLVLPTLGDAWRVRRLNGSTAQDSLQTPEAFCVSRDPLISYLLETTFTPERYELATFDFARWLRLPAAPRRPRSGANRSTPDRRDPLLPLSVGGCDASF